MPPKEMNVEIVILHETNGLITVLQITQQIVNCCNLRCCQDLPMRNSTSTLICSLSVEQDLRVFYFRFLSTKVEEFEKRLEDLRLIGGKFVWREIWLSFAVQRLVLLNGSGTRFGFNRCSQMLSKNVFCQKCLYIGHLEALTQFFCPSA